MALLGEAILKEFLKKYGEDCDIVLTKHAEERMKERDITMGDILHLIKENPQHIRTEASTRSDEGLHKYVIRGKTPSSEEDIVLIIIPSLKSGAFKITLVTTYKEYKNENEHEN